MDDRVYEVEADSMSFPDGGEADKLLIFYKDDDEVPVAIFKYWVSCIRTDERQE